MALTYELTDKLGVYAELFGEKEANQEGVLSAGSGLAYLLLHNLQLDASAALRLSAQGDRGYISGGLCWGISR
ncbi:hypothetical protein ADICEAN_00433 [Cesiribacter andamanensis AMV16]|uniref:Uncharacterized protein n=1 Tax=Cesiribacter andamanensis AMV16 TaxID=1279009 RepID=M7P1B4_9BACT|nr:hypothetical protein ADICEAN_00433 [Cesiribacter andamanensis AMV16]